MVVNKNALHEVIMNYIPKKQVEKSSIPPPIFKGPIPVLGQPISAQSEQTSKVLTTNNTPSISMEKVTVIKNELKPMNKIIEEEIKEQPTIVVKKGGSRKKKSTKKSKKLVKSINKSTPLEQLLDKKEKHDFIDNILDKQSNKNSNIRRSRKSSNKKIYKKTDLIGIETFDVEPKIHKNPFHEVEVKLNRKSKKKSKNKKLSKKKNSSTKSSIRIKKTAPNYLKNDIDRLLSKNDNIAFHRIFI